VKAQNERIIEETMKKEGATEFTQLGVTGREG